MFTAQHLTNLIWPFFGDPPLQRRLLVFLGVFVCVCVCFRLFVCYCLCFSFWFIRFVVCLVYVYRLLSSHVLFYICRHINGIKSSFFKVFFKFFSLFHCFIFSTKLSQPVKYILLFFSNFFQFFEMFLKFFPFFAH